jgi:hypothetical protein
MVIDVELGRKDHSSIPRKAATTIGRELKLLNARIDPQTRLNWWCKPNSLRKREII